jgi:hypothetical protein
MSERGDPSQHHPDGITLRPPLLRVDEKRNGRLSGAVEVDLWHSEKELSGEDRFRIDFEEKGGLSGGELQGVPQYVDRGGQIRIALLINVYIYCRFILHIYIYICAYI